MTLTGSHSLTATADTTNLKEKTDISQDETHLRDRVVPSDAHSNDAFRHVQGEQTQLGSSDPSYSTKLPSKPFPTLSFFASQSLAVIISSALLLWVVCIGLLTRLKTYIPRALTRPPRPQPSWDDPQKWKHERLVKSPQYYAWCCGFDILDEQAETEDGFYLRMHHVRCFDEEKELSSIGRGFPVLIMHGLFQSSGSFITSEERSLAFWLARRGFDVYLGNNRGIFDMGHRHYSRYNPAFWDHDVDDLARYDLPAMIDYVRAQTGYDKIAYIGHSQGNATAFLALSRWSRPELGEKLSYFGALAPAVFAGPLTNRFPLTQLRKVDQALWARLFGVLDFTPLMKFSYDWTPATPYAALGYQMFAYLFEWNDTHWLQRRKAKMFRFTPQPVSSRIMYWWAGQNGFTTRRHLLDPNETWYDERFPPLALYGGGADHLVLPLPVQEHFEKFEPKVRLVRAKILPDAEVRAIDASYMSANCYSSIVIISGLLMLLNGAFMTFWVRAFYTVVPGPAPLTLRRRYSEDATQLLSPLCNQIC